MQLSQFVGSAFTIVVSLGIIFWIFKKLKDDRERNEKKVEQIKAKTDEHNRSLTPEQRVNKLLNPTGSISNGE